MDSRIRIHTKMSWIRNTAFKLTKVKYTVLFCTHLLAHGLGNEVSMFLGSGGHFGTILKPQQQMHLVPETSQQQNNVVRYGARLDNGTIRDCDQQF
jgi:hypothetical protein